MIVMPKRPEKQERKKSPWIAAILNFVLWGLGYIYNGKKGWSAVALIISDIVLSINLGALLGINISLGNAIDYRIPLALLLLRLFFAYDGYKEAQEISK